MFTGSRQGTLKHPNVSVLSASPLVRFDVDRRANNGETNWIRSKSGREKQKTIDRSRRDSLDPSDSILRFPLYRFLPSFEIRALLSRSSATNHSISDYLLPGGSILEEIDGGLQRPGSVVTWKSRGCQGETPFFQLAELFNFSCFLLRKTRGASNARPIAGHRVDRPGCFTRFAKLVAGFVDPEHLFFYKRSHHRSVDGGSKRRRSMPTITRSIDDHESSCSVYGIPSGIRLDRGGNRYGSWMSHAALRGSSVFICPDRFRGDLEPRFFTERRTPAKREAWSASRN